MVVIKKYKDDKVILRVELIVEFHSAWNKVNSKQSIRRVTETKTELIFIRIEYRFWYELECSFCLVYKPPKIKIKTNNGYLTSAGWSDYFEHEIDHIRFRDTKTILFFFILYLILTTISLYNIPVCTQNIFLPQRNYLSSLQSRRAPIRKFPV